MDEVGPRSIIVLTLMKADPFLHSVDAHPLSPVLELQALGLFPRAVQGAVDLRAGIAFMGERVSQDLECLEKADRNRDLKPLFQQFDSKVDGGCCPQQRSLLTKPKPCHERIARVRPAPPLQPKLAAELVPSFRVEKPIRSI
jgi:hypothetical protein